MKSEYGRIEILENLKLRCIDIFYDKDTLRSKTLIFDEILEPYFAIFDDNFVSKSHDF